jgi:hypothetical protein
MLIGFVTTVLAGDATVEPVAMRPKPAAKAPAMMSERILFLRRPVDAGTTLAACLPGIHLFNRHTATRIRGSFSNRSGLLFAHRLSHVPTLDTIDHVLHLL